MTTAAPARVEDLEAKIDALTEQVAFLAEEARLARRRREVWSDLQDDVMPIAGDVLNVLERELEELSADVSLADIGDLIRRFVRVAPILDQGLRYREMVSELFSDMMPLTEHAVDVATDRLVSLDQKGYFAFAKSGLHVVDRIVEGFSEEDVEVAHVVLHRCVVQRQQRLMEDEPEKPPSFFQLARQLRNPEIRRGMARALNTLSAVAEVDPLEPVQFKNKQDKKNP